jgi:hypothetical protein
MGKTNPLDRCADDRVQVRAGGSAVGINISFRRVGVARPSPAAGSGTVPVRVAGTGGETPP